MISFFTAKIPLSAKNKYSLISKAHGERASGHKTINPTYEMFIGRVFHIDERRSAFPSPQSAALTDNPSPPAAELPLHKGALKKQKPPLVFQGAPQGGLSCPAGNSPSGG